VRHHRRAAQRAPALPLAVIEGDQQTSVDADRIRATGAPAIQVNTGKGCHLDAPMVAEAFARLPICTGTIHA
jgi:hydrogenase nickel incorporation protein HypB